MTRWRKVIGPVRKLSGDERPNQVCARFSAIRASPTSCRHLVDKRRVIITAAGLVDAPRYFPRRDLVHVEKFFVRSLGGLTRARTCAGPAREGNSRTPSMYADEKSDEAVVPRKRPSKGRQLPAEVVEGRASPEGNSRQAAVVRTLSRAATSIRLAAVRRSACSFKTMCRRRLT